ncbi:MAG: filamentous hemagglutinin N-terminal domain-containing protein, partial [Proteobacteria bacterium]|nr:filamentous hemagglutinin N-terminal domain-containing protein [Pseudomonadota bacterium]
MRARNRLVFLFSLTLIYSNSYSEVVEVVSGSNISLVSSNGQYDIKEELGSIQGNNLFHDFNQFNIDAGETATFSGSSNIENIISRVSGGDPSAI